MEPIELTPVRDTLHLAPSIAPKITLPTLTDLTTKIPTPAELLQGVTTPQEKVEKDPYKLAEEAYMKKKSPKIDTSSAIAPTEVITPEEYKGFNKDDTISSSVKYDQNYEANKRATQTDGERWLNTAQKFGANATSMFLGGLSTIPNILGSVTNGIGYLAGQETPISEYFNMSPDSGVMKDLFEWSDSVNANNRNYQSNWSKENWIQDLVPFFGDGGFQDIIASAGYTAGAIGEALASGGIASILSKGTKLAGMGAKLSKYLNDPAKIDKVLNAISATKNSKAAQLIGDAGYLMGKSIENSPQLYRAYVGAHVEAAFEGLEGAKRFEEDVVNEYKKNHGGISPDEKELAKIKDLAQNVGDLRYKLNLLTLTIPNYIQMGALLKTFPGASKVAKTLLGKNELGSVQLGDELGSFKVNAVNDIKFNTTNALWDKRIPKAFKNGVEKTLSYGQKFGKIPLSVSEGLEEEMQYFIDEHTTSLYKGAYLNEKGLEENSLYLSGLWDTIQNKLATKEATQAFLMGSMGGGIQQSMNTVYETVFDKNKLKEKIAQNELYAKKLEDISGSLFKSSDVFNVATDDERVQLENYLSKALDQNSLNGTLQENYQKVLASLNTNAATNVAIQKNFLGAQRIYQDLQDRDVSGLLHSVVSSGKQEVFKEHLNSIANATEEEIQNLYGININEQTRDNKQFAKNLIDKLNKIEGYSKKINFAFNDNFEDETDADFYLKYKNQLSHNLYMINRKQERISDLQTANSPLFLDLLQDKKQSINDKIAELKTATSLIPIKDATKRIALLEQLKDGSNVSLKDAVYAYSGESVAELEAVAEFEKANDVLTLKEGRTGIDNLRKYYEELYSTDGFDLFKDQHKDYYDAIKAVREFQQKSADRKVRNEKQYAQLQKDLLVKDDGENIKKAVQKLSEDISNVEDDEKLTKEQKESKKQFLINEAKQKIANLRNSKPVETVEKKTPKTETTKETEIVETPAVKVKDVVVEEITTDVAQKFSEAPLNKEEDLEDVSIDDFDEEVPVVSNDLQSRIKEVRVAIKKAGQGEGGQFFVTLTDGTKLGAVRLGVVGDTLQTSDGEIDFSIITKIENPDGTVLYDSNPSSLIDEEGNVNQGNVAPVVVDKKADIEKRRQETLLKELFEKPETESDYFGKKIFEGDKIGDKGFEIQINSRIFIGRIDVSIKYLKYVKSQKYYYEGAKQYARDTKESIIKDFNSINEALNYAINLLNDEDKQLALKINAKYDEELAALETPIVNLPFDDTNFFGAPPTENTIPEVLLTEAQGLKILQPEYYLALDVLDRDEAKVNFQRRKELINSVTNLSEIPTTVREVAYPAKSINKTEQIYGDVFIKLGGGKLYHLINTNPETGQETILYEFRSLKHGFGLQKTWVDTSYPRIVEELKNTDGLLETTGKDGFTNKPFFFGDFSSYYSLYDVWNLMNEDERSDFLHKFNIRADQMQEAFDTQNVFEKLLASPSEKYELNRILDGWVDSFRGAAVNSYAVDFEKQTTIDTLPQSKFIDAETGNQHHVVVYADFDLLYDGEGNLKTETEYKIAKQKVVDGMQVRVDAGNNTSRITNYILDNLIQQLDSEVLEPVHFLSSGYNLVLSDTNGKPYIKSLFPSTDLKGNEVLNKNLHALVESADWNGKSTREAGFHILLNNLSNKVGYSVEVSNVKFNFYTKQDGKQVRSIAVSLEWVDKDTKKSKTLHISLKENLTEEGRYEKNIKEISDGLIKQVEKEFGVTGISAKFVAAEAKEPVDVPTILKNNNSVELGVFWNRNDFRKDTPVLFNSDRVIPRIVEEYEQELKEESSVALPVVSTKIEEAKTKTAAPIEQSDIPPIQAMVNKHVGEKGMILQKDENITSEKALLFGADVVKIMEQSKDAEQMLNEMLEDSKTISENETHSDIKSILSLLYFNPKFESLRPYFNTQPKPIDSNCVLTQN